MEPHGRGPTLFSATAVVQAVAERVFQQCLQTGQYDHAVGLALEARHLDRLRTAVEAGAGRNPGLLDYALQVCTSTP